MVDKKEFFESIKDLPVEEKIERLREFEKQVQKEKEADLQKAEQLIKESEIELIRDEEESKKFEEDITRKFEQAIPQETLTKIIEEESRERAFADELLKQYQVTSETPIQYLQQEIQEMSNASYLTENSRQRLGDIYHSLGQKRNMAEARNLSQYVTSELSPAQEAAKKLLNTLYQK